MGVGGGFLEFWMEDGVEGCVDVNWVVVEKVWV